jgi:hypothetical protein
LHRWFGFIETLLAKSQDGTFDVSSELAELFVRVSDVLQTGLKQLSSAMKPAARAKMVEALSEAGSDYRCQLYAQGLGGQTRQLTMDQVLQFARASRLHLESTIKNNRRSDGLYHSYNLIRWTSEGVCVEHLYEMLEGQVAVLSAGVLSPSESVELLDALRCSPLYRENQLTYMLYPDRQLPRFTDKNQLSDQQVASSPLLQQLLADKNSRIVRRDAFGDVHFNGGFRNSADLRAALRNLPQVYQEKVAAETETLAEVFEDVFEHRQFTGRSGTFFAYEGLGSIYWHMVSKLGLAVAENFFDAVERSAEAGVLAALRGHYQAIREGIGAEKSPADYGAFPSDPYSHTPENAGVKQPGMTGQVKEDLLARFQEVGVHVEGGRLSFRLELFDKDELLQEAGEFSYYTPAGTPRTLTIPEGGFAFTLCQVPIVYTAADRDEIRIRFESGDQQTLAGRSIDAATTAKLFARGGEIQWIECQFENLR